MLNNYVEIIEAIKNTNWLKTASRAELEDALKKLMSISTANVGIIHQCGCAHDQVILEIQTRFK